MCNLYVSIWHTWVSSNYFSYSIYSGLTADPARVRKRVKLEVVEAIAAVVAFLVVIRDYQSLLRAHVHWNLVTK